LTEIEPIHPGTEYFSQKNMCKIIAIGAIYIYARELWGKPGRQSSAGDEHDGFPRNTICYSALEEAV
jgi:hypothetical protein